ncbi:sulfonate transport system permease protein [Amycolatopsis bartoniae]|uniref:ABC transporter permease n=1 Tax=Amycolatopsis bartoniae TaxID=941986 RepID=A0A8H9MB24_9PSEU|nr:ABC transporter permease [Amycolatopsis bartoniae]MBB2937174.1 sulfonate transport system permease protein [Amycolatopsis bartoniae]TVT06044.1 ABC transporter permease [Amycolatopsis bartoniae]GHF52992.1 ABC transporter permease [Amycolatopsis bartoniae]
MSLTATGVLARPEETAEGPPPPRKRRLPDLRRWLSPLALLGLWQVASSTGLLPADKLSSPWTVLQAGIETARSGELGDAFVVSLGRVAAGFAIGAAVALVLGVAAGLSAWAGVLIDPPVQMLRTLPFLGLIPLFILWFGIGEEPKILLVALGVLFPLYLNIFSALRGVDPDLVEAAKALGYTRGERLLHVQLPSAVPQALVGLRQSLGVAWLALIVGETVNADAGLGYLITNARDFLRTDVIVVGLVVYAVLGLATDALVRLVERRALRWRHG